MSTGMTKKWNLTQYKEPIYLDDKQDRPIILITVLVNLHVDNTYNF